MDFKINFNDKEVNRTFNDLDEVKTALFNLLDMVFPEQAAFTPDKIKIVIHPQK